MRILFGIVLLSLQGSVAWGHQQVFDASDAANPAIAVDSHARLWTVAWEQMDGKRRAIVYATSSDGRTFSKPKTFPRMAPDSLTGNPSVAVDRFGHVSAVWVEGVRGETFIRFARSDDRGRTFADPKTISPGKGQSRGPKIAVDGKGNVFVVWAASASGRFDVLFSRSSDGGKTFSPPRNLSDNKYLSEFPAIAVDAQGAVYVVWRDKEPPTIQVWFTRSTDGGKTFSPRKVVSSTGFSDSPAIAAERDGIVYVVWMSNVTGNRSIFFQRSTDGGETFGELLNLTQTKLPSESPSIAADGAGNVYVGWADRTPGKFDVVLRHSPDRGESFYPMVTLSAHLPGAQSPALAAIRGEGIFAVWKGSGERTDGILFIDQEEMVGAPHVR